ncbi:MAG: hypothetical protein AB1489_29435 [Acidobacteriota bacterium]
MSEKKLANCYVDPKEIYMGLLSQVHQDYDDSEPSNIYFVLTFKNGLRLVLLGEGAKEFDQIIGKLAVAGKLNPIKVRKGMDY